MSFPGAFNFTAIPIRQSWPRCQGRPHWAGVQLLLFCFFFKPIWWQHFHILKTSDKVQQPAVQCWGGFHLSGRIARISWSHRIFFEGSLSQVNNLRCFLVKWEWWLVDVECGYTPLTWLNVITCWSMWFGSPWVPPQYAKYDQKEEAKECEQERSNSDGGKLFHMAWYYIAFTMLGWWWNSCSWWLWCFIDPISFTRLRSGGGVVRGKQNPKAEFKERRQ